MIIAVDFDDTLRLSDGKPNFSLLKSLKESQIMGNKVILHTTRTGKSLIDAVNWCTAHGLALNGVHGGKPYADFYIDDKAINPFKG